LAEADTPRSAANIFLETDFSESRTTINTELTFPASSTIAVIVGVSAAIDGIARAQGSAGVDLGAMEEPVAEEQSPTADGASTEVAAGEAAPGKALPGDGQVFEILTAPRGAPDDLAKLPGVGPQIVKKLNDAGIYHYWQIAAMTAADAAKIDRELRLAGRIERDGWIELARGFVAG
jgi:small subunit ribosomal protein S2